MQKLILLFVFFLAAKASFSQQQYFVYIQSEDKQPFYVLLNGKTYSSSENGHVILSKLTDSTHHVSIGFPKKIFPEQIFTITINKKDAGYQLKNLGEKGWVLFNLQTLNLVMSGSTVSAEKKSPDFSGVKKTDEFSILLANVVNDSAILYSAAIVQQKPPAKSEDKTVVTVNQKADSIPPPPSIATDTIEKKAVASATVAQSTGQKTTTTSAPKDVSSPGVSPAVAVVPITGSAKDESPAKPSQATSKIDSNAKKTGEVIKIGETNTGNNLNLTFISRMYQQTDTIQVTIPIEKTEEKAVVALPITTGNDNSAAKTTTQAAAPAVTAAAVTKVDSTQQKKNNAPPPINDCKNYATEGDVDKLRVKILAAKTHAEKIEAVKKVYKTKCFSVKQVKALSELFKTDEERFQFFEASYKSVSDAYNFKELGNLLNDEAYRNRFNEM